MFPIVNKIDKFAISRNLDITIIQDFTIFKDVGSMVKEIRFVSQSLFRNHILGKPL